MRRRFFSKIINKAISIPSTIDINNYMTIEAIEDGVVVQFPSELIYSVDAVNNWRVLSANTPVTINSGQTISFKANLTSVKNVGIGTFTITGGQCMLLGNCMSLLYGDNASSSNSLSGYNYAFYKLFYDCATIKNVSEDFLPATILTTYCYYSMFQNCTSLTIAPKLPATTLATYCYYAMFSGCTKLVTSPALPSTVATSNCYREMFRGCSVLTTAPELPATTLASNCYNRMFYGCTKLATAPELPATSLAASCYLYMFYGCKAITTAPELPATTLQNNCYQYMFRNCTSLTASPLLYAEVLTNYSYSNMFRGCSKLNHITMFATNISASSCLANWVNGVASTGTFVKYASLTTMPTGANGIPSGWTVKNLIESYWQGMTGAPQTFYAEEGMTWGEWINSKYNIFGLAFNNGHLVRGIETLIDSNGDITETTVIKEEYTYGNGLYEGEEW